MEHKIGIVFSGGGAKGSYEIGVYRALLEARVTEYVDGFVGTSVGALNAALIAGCGIDHAENVWRDLETDTLVHPETANPSRQRVRMIADILLFLFPLIPSPVSSAASAIRIARASAMLRGAVSMIQIRNAVNLVPWVSPALEFILYGLPVSQGKIAELIDKEIDFEKLRKEVHVVCWRISKLKAECFYLNTGLMKVKDKKNALLASSSIPGIYSGMMGVRVNGHRYCDSGWTPKHNTPILHACNQGYQKIIAVHLTHKPDKSTLKSYKEAEIVHIIPSAKIDSIIPLKETIRLTPEKTKELIALGYEDTRNKMDEIRKLIHPTWWDGFFHGCS